MNLIYTFCSFGLIILLPGCWHFFYTFFLILNIIKFSFLFLGINAVFCFLGVLVDRIISIILNLHNIPVKIGFLFSTYFYFLLHALLLLWLLLASDSLIKFVTINWSVEFLRRNDINRHTSTLQPLTNYLKKQISI